MAEIQTLDFFITLTSDTMSRNQLNQKLKLMIEAPEYVIYLNISFFPFRHELHVFDALADRFLKSFLHITYYPFDYFIPDSGFRIVTTLSSAEVVPKDVAHEQVSAYNLQFIFSMKVFNCFTSSSPPSLITPEIVSPILSTRTNMKTWQCSWSYIIMLQICLIHLISRNNYNTP